MFVQQISCFALLFTLTAPAWTAAKQPAGVASTQGDPANAPALTGAQAPTEIVENMPQTGEEKLPIPWSAQKNVSTTVVPLDVTADDVATHAQPSVSVHLVIDKAAEFGTQLFHCRQARYPSWSPTLCAPR